jgi:hypothetical protein
MLAYSGSAGFANGTRVGDFLSKVPQSAKKRLVTFDFPGAPGPLALRLGERLCQGDGSARA